MLSGLLKMSGFFILKLIYGKDSKKIEKFGVGIPLLLSTGFVFWLLSLMFLFLESTAEDTLIALIFGIGYPLMLLIWGIVARINGKKALKKCEASKGKPRPIQQTKKAPQEETTVERWYTCPECGSLVKDGEICDCVAKRKEEEAAKRAEEAIVNEPPSVWAYRWINSQRALGTITDEQYKRMGDAVASWEAPQEPSKNSKRDRRLMIFLGSACAIFMIVSISFGIVLSNAYADHEKLESDYERAVEDYTRLAETSKRQVEIIARKNARISELENGFSPEYEKWGEGIYNGEVYVLLQYENIKDTFIFHRADCTAIKNVALADRLYFPSKLDARLFCARNSFLPVMCSECNPID